jgi:hypothetical protein
MSTITWIRALLLFPDRDEALHSESLAREKAAEEAAYLSMRNLRATRLDYDTRPRHRTLDDVLERIDETDHAMREALGDGQD